MHLKPDDPRAAEFVEILLAARRHIENGHQLLVCMAIGDDSKNSRTLKAWITNAIAPHYSVTSWLNAQGVPIEQLTRCSEQVYRLRWIDHMIDYFTPGGVGDVHSRPTIPAPPPDRAPAPHQAG